MDRIRNIQQFLEEDASTKGEVYVALSERLKAHRFKFRPLSADEVDKINRYSRGKDGEINAKVHQEQVFLTGCVEPNFRDAEWIKRVGVVTPEQLLHKMLRYGEILKGYIEIEKLTSEPDFEVIVEQVKNC